MYIFSDAVDTVIGCAYWFSQWIGLELDKVRHVVCLINSILISIQIKHGVLHICGARRLWRLAS